MKARGCDNDPGDSAGDRCNDAQKLLTLIVDGVIEVYEKTALAIGCVLASTTRALICAV